jgi:hypothetical protein
MVFFNYRQKIYETLMIGIIAKGLNPAPGNSLALKLPWRLAGPFMMTIFKRSLNPSDRIAQAF